MSSDATNSRSNSQFEPLTFDASASPGAASCAKCGTQLRGSYHMVDESMACAKCRYAAEAQSAGGTGAGALLRAIGFGTGAAILGAVGYYAFVKITDIEWALLTALVGIGVGMAVRVGSRGHGGRKYQVVALVLTYFAMSGAYLPFIAAGVDEASKASAGVLALGLLTTPVFVAFASPISGLFIAYALYRAWKSNAGGLRPVTTSGPFRLQQSPDSDASPA